jgi:MoaA/NifB/PqqE/SkfB family radical SAM enzyme
MKNKETLEEFAIKIAQLFGTKDSFEYIKNSVKYGAKWQQEQHKKLYSEEEVLEFTQKIIQQYKFGNTNIEQMDLLKETLQQFKNK